MAAVAVDCGDKEGRHVASFNRGGPIRSITLATDVMSSIVRSYNFGSLLSFPQIGVSCNVSRETLGTDAFSVASQIRAGFQSNLH